MKHTLLTIALTTISFACYSADDAYTPVPQQEIISMIDTRKAIDIRPGKENIPYQLAFKSLPNGDELICLIADPNLNQFPADFSQSLINKLSLTASKATFRKALEEGYLSADPMIQKLTPVRLAALFGITNDGCIKAAFLPTEMGSKSPFTIFKKTVLITFQKEYTSPDIKMKSIKLYKQHEIAAHAPASGETPIRTADYLKAIDYDIAIKIDHSIIEEGVKKIMQAKRAAFRDHDDLTYGPETCLLQ